ncbi:MULTISPECIES: hypothetical protein [Enterococcus]|uniref:hypothetical protein n=1 Tax=Enterococcus TaxID=1350 RepID=UPI0020908353|nr:hypothetical protein [Enterococcus innesii]MCO5497294.1 hypothetical protein [Enterococcus innesii]MEC5315627.1 hypothetical protein [Enterococcus casseliflavus]
MGMIKPYEDRKKLKWVGFFLSEHTADIARIEKELKYTCPAKPEMDEKEISEFLQTAVTKNRKLAIQLNHVVDDKYMPDFTGTLKGYDDLGFYLDDTLVHYDEIRSVDYYSEVKWFDV